MNYNLKRIIRDSVRQALRESTVGVRGTETHTDVYPVPYDDDYIDRYGNSPSYDKETSENKYIEKYAGALAQRIEDAFSRRGVDVHVEYNEDIEDIEDFETGDERDIRTLSFDIRTRTMDYVAFRAIEEVLKRLEMMSVVCVAYVNDIKPFIPPRGYAINIRVSIKPDKNGMEIVPKFPRYRSNNGSIGTSRSKYVPRKDDDDED